MVGNNVVNEFDILGLEQKAPLRVAMRGLNPDPSNPDMVDGANQFIAGGVNIGQGLYFSREQDTAMNYIFDYFDADKDGKLDKNDCPPFKVRLVGYSWGAWSALQMTHKLANSRRITNKKDIHLALGTVDPVNTGRDGKTGWIPGTGPGFNVQAPVGITLIKTINFYQQNGLENRKDRKAFNWAFKGNSVRWAQIDHNASAEGGFGGMSVEILPPVPGEIGKPGRPAVRKIGHMGMILKYGPTLVGEILNLK